MKASKEMSFISQGEEEYLQFIINKLEKHGSVPLCHLIGCSSQLSGDIQMCVRSSPAELKMFLKKYMNIFEVDDNDIVHLLNFKPKEIPETETKPKYQNSSNTTDIPKVAQHENKEDAVAHSTAENKAEYKIKPVLDECSSLKDIMKEGDLLEFFPVESVDPRGASPVFLQKNISWSDISLDPDEVFHSDSSSTDSEFKSAPASNVTSEASFPVKSVEALSLDPREASPVFLQKNISWSDISVDPDEVFHSDSSSTDSEFKSAPASNVTSEASFPVKSVEALSLDPREASPVFLQKNISWSDISVDPDEVFHSDSSSTDSEFKSAPASNVTSEASFDVKNV